MKVGIRTIAPPVAPERPDAVASRSHVPEATWVIEELPAPPSTQPPITGHDRRVVTALALCGLLIATGLAGRWLVTDGVPSASSHVSPSAAPTTRTVAAAATATPSSPVAPAAAVATAVASSAPTGAASVGATVDTVASVTTVRHIDRRFTEPGTDGRVLAVWQETGSSSTACLATPNEASAGAPTAWLTVYCAPRDMRIGDSIRHGLFLHLFLGPPDGDLGTTDGNGVDRGWTGYYDVNAYQEGASYYGTPVPWVDPYMPAPVGAAAAATGVVGAHDGSTEVVADAERCHADGWTLDRDHADARLPVRVLADHVQVWRGVADTPRSDVEAAGIGDGHNGFWISLAGLVTPATEHVVRVQAQDPDTGAWVDLDQTPRRITCAG